MGYVHALRFFYYLLFIKILKIDLTLSTRISVIH